MVRYVLLSLVVACLCRGTRGFPVIEDLPIPGFYSQVNDNATSTGSENNGDITVLSGDPPLGLNFLFSVNYSSAVDFYLFKKKEGEIQMTKLEKMDAQGVLDAGFEKSRATKIVIHGFSNDLNSSFVQLTSKSYASDFDYNVIAVDWGKLSNGLLYPTARYHVQGVGEYVGKLLSTLCSASLVEPGDLHLIGHSLGAHVSSYAGKAVQKEGWSLGRITGLDPASVLFHDPSQRLTKNDAATVDIIHTCIGYLGIGGNNGHIDFYPNGGGFGQPGCSFDWTGVCSHGRSFEYFVESIQRPNAFVGHHCKSENDLHNCDNGATAVMGASLSFTLQGAYYLKTAASSPFGLS